MGDAQIENKKKMDFGDWSTRNGSWDYDRWRNRYGKGKI